MFRVFSETLPGVQYRDRNRTASCAAAWADVGENYSLFAVGEYSLPPAVAATTSAQEIVAQFVDSASGKLMDDIFNSDTVCLAEYFDPVRQFIRQNLPKIKGPQQPKADVGCLVIEKSTMKGLFYARGKINIWQFDKQSRQYEPIWPRYGRLTAMAAPVQLGPQYNLLIANETFFRLLYNRKEDRLYKLYEMMLLEDLKEPFYLKGLADTSYITVDLSCRD